MAMKGSMLNGIIKMKCPRCQESNLFSDPNPYNLSKLLKMPDRCDKCGQKFEIEPGFFYGSMYVSYGLSIAYLVAVWVAMIVLYPDFNVTEYLVIAVGSLIALTPLFFRLSRSVWIHFFVKYDEHAIEKWQKKKTEEKTNPNSE